MQNLTPSPLLKGEGSKKRIKIFLISVFQHFSLRIRLGGPASQRN
jgi:hypothetical protein